MRIKIAHDARPQVRLLLLATLISVALWFIPFTGIVTFPFRIFVTFIHEGGHAIAALLTGNAVQSLAVAMNGSGETYTNQGGMVSRMFVSSAGYMGTMLYGALLLILIRRSVAARLVLAGSAILVVALTLIYGIFNPIRYGIFPSVFTVFAGALISCGLLLAGAFASKRLAAFLVSFLAVQCVLDSLFDLRTVLFLSAPFGSGTPTDAANMASATGVPALFWAILWTAVAFLILSLALRAYAASCGRAKQPDLPFEDV